MSSSRTSSSSSSGGGLISKTVHAVAQTLGIEKKAGGGASSSSGGTSSSGLTAASKSYAADLQPGRRKSVPGIIPDDVAAAQCQGFDKPRADHEIGSSAGGRFEPGTLEHALYAATMDEKLALEYQPGKQRTAGRA